MAYNKTSPWRRKDLSKTTLSIFHVEVFQKIQYFLHISYRRMLTQIIMTVSEEVLLKYKCCRRKYNCSKWARWIYEWIKSWEKQQLFILNIFLYDCFIVIDTHMESLSLVSWRLMYAENIHNSFPPVQEDIWRVSVKNSVNRYMETILPRILKPDLCFLLDYNTVRNTIEYCALNPIQ